MCDCVCYRRTSKTDKTRAGVCVKLHFARNGVALHWQLLATATARMQGACEVERVPVRSCTRVCMHASQYIFTCCARARSDGLERHGLFAAGSLAPGSFAANTPRARLIRRRPDALCKCQESLRQHRVKRIWTMASKCRAERIRISRKGRFAACVDRRGGWRHVTFVARIAIGGRCHAIQCCLPRSRLRGRICLGR